MFASIVQWVDMNSVGISECRSKMEMMEIEHSDLKKRKCLTKRKSGKIQTPLDVDILWSQGRRRRKHQRKKWKAAPKNPFHNGKRILKMSLIRYIALGGEKRDAVTRSSWSLWEGFIGLQFGKQPKTLPYVRNKVFTSHRISPRRIGRPGSNSGQKSSRPGLWVKKHFTEATSQ